MLWKLQRKTLIPAQIIGYLLGMFLGMAIIACSVQLFFDVRPLLSQQSDIFNNQAAVVSKKISVFKTLNKEKIYFTNAELNEIKTQPFVKDIAVFGNATFSIGAFTNESSSIPMFYTELFFESIPNKYLDVKPDEWEWNPSLDFIPIVIPENYLNLYNFGFAESQGLPVISKNIISQISFNIRLSGNGKTKVYKSRIVGFSTRINSILVPEKFLVWANDEYGRMTDSRVSHILVEFNDPSDKNILQYFHENDYDINQQELEYSKLIFFFKIAIFFVLFIAATIVVLSVAFIILSLNLIIQKNRETLMSLSDIGYSGRQIARFYQLTVSSITVISIIAAMTVALFVRQLYLEQFSQLFDFVAPGNSIVLICSAALAALLLLYNFLILKTITTISR
ncbi:MAG: ABC transporter permease [Bacteroidales bacterium]|jgi:hypothetical protein|nr:ABC transporter permease [Bacteroidales bacterium]